MPKQYLLITWSVPFPFVYLSCSIANDYASYQVGTVTQEHAHKDIDNAKSMGLDGFALNIGDATRDYVSQALSYLFPYAESVGFKLYISMDVYASGDACYHGAKSVCEPTFLTYRRCWLTVSVPWTI